VLKSADDGFGGDLQDCSDFLGGEVFRNLHKPTVAASWIAGARGRIEFAPKRVEGSHRNWFRSEQTLRDIEKKIERTLKSQPAFTQFRLVPEK
jgi:hypothetical protein